MCNLALIFSPYLLTPHFASSHALPMCSHLILQAHMLYSQAHKLFLHAHLVFLLAHKLLLHAHLHFLLAHKLLLHAHIQF